MEGVEDTVGPIESVQGLLVLGRKLGVGAELHARGRAEADVDGGREAVGIILGPFAAAVAPAKLAAADAMADARGAVPGRADVPLHVGVPGEQLAVGIEVEIERIAEAAADKLPVLGVGVELGDPAARGHDVAREIVAVRHTRHEMVFPPALDDAAGVDVRKLREVTADDVQRLAVWTEADGMRAMLTAAVELTQQLGGIVLVVALGRAQAIEAVALASAVGDHDVQAIEGVEKTVRLAAG